MWTILTEITRPAGAVPGEWPGAGDAPGPEPGRFCFVGDDQQAIYGERADLAVYRRYIDAFQAGDAGRYLEFSVTMRCPRRVIDAVNGVFGGGRIEQEFVEFRELDPRPGCPDGAAWRLELAPVEKADGKPNLEARLTRECEQVADFVQARGLAGLGVRRWSEVAVICPRVRWLETAARIFAERGLPGALLSQRRLARELARYSWPAALLHVLIHPWDRFELIGVLREIFAVSDVDMARLHRQASAPGGGGGAEFLARTACHEKRRALHPAAPRARTAARTARQAARGFARARFVLARCAGERPGLRDPEPLRRYRAGTHRPRRAARPDRRTGFVSGPTPGARPAGGVRGRHVARLGAVAGERAGRTRADPARRAGRGAVPDVSQGEGLGVAGGHPAGIGVRNPRTQRVLSARRTAGRPHGNSFQPGDGPMPNATPPARTVARRSSSGCST